MALLGRRHDPGPHPSGLGFALDSPPWAPSLTGIICWPTSFSWSSPPLYPAGRAAWQFTHRFDLSLVLVAALAALSLTIWRDNWQLCWLNPCVWALSDDFSNFRILRSAAYMRLTWLLGLAGLWALSYLCIRRYGRGPLGSLARTARRVYLAARP